MRRTLCVGIAELKNLTQENIALYSYSGSIVNIPPSEYEADEAFYIVDKTDNRVDIAKQVVVMESGKGRNGVQVKTLFLATDKRVRVMPEGE